MKSCAIELAPKKVRVNSVNPGMVNTKLIHGGSITEEQHQADMERYPLKRYGEPEDIAFGIIYLLSDAASWITGHSLVIDGGITI
jgi:NAD(P)-dependent dehydrogenase (short-subunit alcohol dehydrogenase family)